MTLYPPRSLFANAASEGFQRNVVRLFAVFTIGVAVLAIIAELTLSNGTSRAILIPLMAIVIQAALFEAARRYPVPLSAAAQVIVLLGLGIAGDLTGTRAVGSALTLLALFSAATVASTGAFLAVSCIAAAHLGLFLELPTRSEALAFDLILRLMIVMTLVFMSAAVRYALASQRRAVDASQRALALLQGSAAVGQLASRPLSLESLLDQTIQVMGQQGGFDHVQVFLLNKTRDQATLVASSSEGGQRSLAGVYRTVGSQSLIGQVTLHGEPMIAHRSYGDYGHLHNELVATAQTEVALPLIDGDAIIGAVDVQSAKANAFSPQDIRVLEITASLLTAAIRSARQIESAAHILAENERLRSEAAENARQIERLNRQLTGAGWNRYWEEAPATRGVTLDSNRIVLESAWTPELLEARDQHRPVQAMVGDQPVIAVPVVLRGEVIGAIEVEPDSRSPDAIDLVQAVAQRLALSLDNARLIEEAQTLTAQEQHVNEIVARFQSAASVDDLMRITITELSRLLGAERAAIRLRRESRRSP